MVELAQAKSFLTAFLERGDQEVTTACHPSSLWRLSDELMSNEPAGGLSAKPCRARAAGAAGAGHCLHGRHCALSARLQVGQRAASNR